MTRWYKRERSAAPTAEVKREAGPPHAKKPKGKSDGKGGKNKGTRYTVDQSRVQLCFSWNFGGGTCGELSIGKPMSGGQSSQMHHVSVGQALGKAVSTDLTRSRGGRNWDSGGGPPIPDWARRRMLDFLALFFGSGKIRAGLGYFDEPFSFGEVSRSESSTLNGTDLLADEPSDLRFPLVNFHFDGFALRFRPGSSCQPRQVSTVSTCVCVHRTVECSSS